MGNQTLIVLLSMLVFTSPDAFSQASWEVDKNQDGIIVYTKVEKDSDYKAFKAVMIVGASTAEIVAVLKNADSYTKWYGYTKTSKVLKREQDVQYQYVETMFPWPYRNRDMVYKMSVNTSNPAVVDISLTGIPDYIPENKGIVRMKKAEGFILLKSLAGQTEVTYQFHSEPGEHIPAWLANNSIAMLPYKTLKGLREILSQESKTR